MAKETAFSRKATVSPPAAMSRPAIAGPRTNARLSRVAHAELAGPSCALVGDQVRQVGADRRAEERREAGREDRHRDDRLDRAVDRDEPGEHDHDQAAGDVGDHEDVAPVEPVGDDPGRHREQDVRQDAGGPDDPEQHRILAAAVDDDQQGDEIEPVADRRDEFACEKASEPPVPEQTGIGAKGIHVGHRAKSRLGGRARSARGRKLDSLELEERALDGEALLTAAVPVAAVPADGPVAGDDAVARNDDSDRVPAHRAAHGTRRPGRADASRDLPVARRGAPRDRADTLQNAPVPVASDADVEVHREWRADGR